MKIAVLSGKGGTGKTLVSVNLAALAERSLYIDCDVEEPNGHLFFKPTNILTEDVTVKIPLVDNELCNGCRECVQFCRFNALAYVNERLLLNDGICHSCGGCVLLCPQSAFSEKEKVIGRIDEGRSLNVKVKGGRLNIGEASGLAIIQRLLAEDPEEQSLYQFIDCPPGSSCSVMESIKDVDYCLLIAEPTIFGAHNLEMVYELVELFGKKYGVVINKYLDADNPVERFCQQKKINILAKIPFDKELGLINSRGQIASRESGRFKEMFSMLLARLVKELEDEAIADPEW